MKKRIVILLLACGLLSGCSNNVSLESSDQNSTLQSSKEQSDTKSDSEPSVSQFKGKTRKDFEQHSDMYNFYQGDECIVSKNNELKDKIFFTSSYDPKNMTLAGLYQYEPNTKSSEIAYQILKTFSDTVDTAERNTAYQHIYLDWALWGGKPVAYWTLSRGSDGKFYQDSDIIWYDSYVEDAFNKLING